MKCELPISDTVVMDMDSLSIPKLSCLLLALNKNPFVRKMTYFVKETSLFREKYEMYSMKLRTVAILMLLDVKIRQVRHTQCFSPAPYGMDLHDFCVVMLIPI